MIGLAGAGGPPSTTSVLQGACRPARRIGLGGLQQPYECVDQAVEVQLRLDPSEGALLAGVTGHGHGGKAHGGLHAPAVSGLVEVGECGPQQSAQLPAGGARLPVHHFELGGLGEDDLVAERDHVTTKLGFSAGQVEGGPGHDFAQAAQRRFGLLGEQGLEPGRAPSLQFRVALLAQGVDEPLQVAEVVLQGGLVPLPGGTYDLADRHVPDAVLGDQLLGRQHQAAPGGRATRPGVAARRGFLKAFRPGLRGAGCPEIGLRASGCHGSGILRIGRAGSECARSGSGRTTAVREALHGGGIGRTLTRFDPGSPIP